MTDELHDLLRATVPDPPASPDRASLVRERARRGRRRTTGGVGLTIVTMVALVATVPALVADDRRGAVAPTPTPSVADITCPRADEPTHGPTTVAVGAVAVRLCRGPGLPIDPPADQLLTGAERVVATINAQTARSMPATACRQDLGRGYQLVFSYPDGHTQNVTGELYGCHTLTVGSAFRSDPQKPFDTFVELLRAQRAGATPPTASVRRPGCGKDGMVPLSPVGRAREMVTATLCVQYSTQTSHGPVAVPVPAADLSVLLDDRTPAASPDPFAPTLRLVGRTAWGDTVGAVFDDAWSAGARAQKILDRLVAETRVPRPTIDSSSRAKDVVAAYADLLNAGDRKGASALWHPGVGRPDLPTAYAHVDAQPETSRRLRTVSAWRDAVAVTALYRVVPPGEPVTDYREAVFLLGRDDKGVFRIVSMHLGEVVPNTR